MTLRHHPLHRRIIAGSFILIFCLALVLFSTILLGRNDEHNADQGATAADHNLDPLNADTQSPATGLLHSSSSSLDNTTTSASPLTHITGKNNNLTTSAAAAAAAEKREKQAALFRAIPRLGGSLTKGSVLDPPSGSSTPYPSSAPSDPNIKIPVR